MPCCFKTKSTKKGPRNEPRYFERALSNIYHLVIAVCLVLTSFGCTRTAEKFCGVDGETLKQNLIRLLESSVIKDDDSVNATSITIDNVEPLPLSEGKADVSFVVRWTTGVDDALTDHSGNWQANLQKAKDGHCHVMGCGNVLVDELD